MWLSAWVIKGPGIESFPEGRGNPSKDSGREWSERCVLDETLT